MRAHVLWLVVVAGCGAGAAPPERRVAREVGAAVAADVPVGAPADLPALMRRVHFAFRPTGSGFASEDARYSALASAAGLRFVPRAAGVTGGALVLESRLSR